MSLLGIMGIGCVGRESRSACPKSRAGIFQLLCCRFIVPAPVSAGGGRGGGCSFCVMNSSQVWPTHLFCSGSAALQLPFISCTRSAALPNDSHPGMDIITPQLRPGAFNWPVLLPEVIRGQMRNGKRVPWRERDSHCHALPDLCQSTGRERVALNCLLLSITWIRGIFMLGMSEYH